ncbi:hypothetical protein K432DRAFT_380791 [Lepidopterella palustris CBS 459.81]|uniref:Uncharacterized protein n=1 Tax=Lepidopterella palustris CBS 459.81 TaxID=1314670 RepID=A0A8E2EDH6_9PEZI|nr:hypothetical protein K432DRAFT_380791 [Lepidopterella palustris CBS 459.81]
MDALSSALAALRRALNVLLPFTDPSTPVLQDIIHTLVLCAALYFAPAIFEHRLEQNLGPTPAEPLPETQDPEAVDDGDIAAELPPLQPQAIIEEDSDDADIFPPPLAPTPPPLQNAAVRPPLFDEDDDAGVGPPNLLHPRPTPQNRVVGAKKAKSLARKDQRRAYHEFVRQRSEAQRAADAEGAEEREEALAEEKRRRAVVEMEIEEKLRKEREAKKEEERREQELEMQRRDRVVKCVRETLGKRGLVDLAEVGRREGKERAWVEKLIRVSGVVGPRTELRDGVCVMVTGGGWAVWVDEQIMREAYARAVEAGMGKGDGRITFNDLGGALEQVVKERGNG